MARHSSGAGVDFPSLIPPVALSPAPSGHKGVFDRGEGAVAPCQGVQGSSCLQQQHSWQRACFSHLQFAARAKPDCSLGVRFLEAGAGPGEQLGWGISSAGQASERILSRSPKRDEIYLRYPKVCGAGLINRWTLVRDVKSSAFRFKPGSNCWGLGDDLSHPLRCLSTPGRRKPCRCCWDGAALAVPSLQLPQTAPVSPLSAALAPL